MRFLPYCYVIGSSHPPELAKRFGIVDLSSGGRMIMGFGVGNFEPESCTVGQSFADRGPIAADTLRALRATLGNTVSSYSGEYFEYESYVVSPNAVQAHVPMWIADHNRRALRRATELGDGWMPTPSRYGGPDDPATSDYLEAATAGPATVINVRFKYASRAELIDQMDAFAAIASFEIV